MAKLKAKIFASPNKGMTGKELRRLRNMANMSQEQLAAKMADWGWTRTKLAEITYGLENQKEFYLPPYEMQALLDALNASSL